MNNSKFTISDTVIDCFVLDIASEANLKKIAEDLSTDFVVLIGEDCEISFLQNGLLRFVQIALDTGAGMLYSDFYQNYNGEQKFIPTIEYQSGSLRDDFYFGSIVFFDAKILKRCVLEQNNGFNFAALYDLRLRVSEISSIFHIGEPLYVSTKKEIISNETKQFAYVDTKNQKVQTEMEIAVTQHLRRLNAFVEPNFKKVNFDMEHFELEASVIIPVKNREETICDAINSALKQKTSFDFNIIVIDNCSTDNTTKIINTLAEENRNKNVVHIIPEEKNLGIGGCWNVAVNCSECGKFAVQLDSDDIYENEYTLQRIVDEFYLQQSAMIIGSYTMVNFDLQRIPPGVIRHLEWTETNGMNNGLRLNGFGAPRAFFTPIIRQLQFPNVSYGEDYAVALRISREYKTGRIFDSIYLCRRWDSNSDANISIERLNSYNFYKDKIRTIELNARISN
jgi:hypothetical protein